MATGYLIDTNVISELRRREPEPRVLSWYEERPARQLFLIVLTMGEIRSSGRDRQPLATVQTPMTPVASAVKPEANGFADVPQSCIPCLALGVTTRPVKATDRP
jgi:hypothetical protein